MTDHPVIPPTPPRPDFIFDRWDSRPDPTREFEDVEERLVGTWFARIGAMTLVAGAGSAFAYAVQRGWIGPAARLATALGLGVAAILVAERVRSHGWSAPAQALAAAGTALLYLTIWAASRVYDFVPLPAGLVLLSAIVVLGAALAMRHRSEALAVMSLGAGFLNPYATEAVSGPATLAYAAVLDLGVLLLAARTSWRWIPRFALVGSWIVASTAGPLSVAAQIGWGAVIFAIFAARPFVSAGSGQKTTIADAALIAGNSFAYLSFAELALDPDSPARGPVAFAIAGVLAGLWLVARRREDDMLERAFGGAAIAIAAVAVPIQWHGLTVGTVWSAQGVLLLWLAGSSPQQETRIAGVALIALGLFRSVGLDLRLGAEYLPNRVLISSESLTVAVQVASLSAAIALLRPRHGAPWEREVRRIAVFTVNLVALGWISTEARAYAFHHLAGMERERAIMFAFSAIWALYGAALFAVGIARDSREIRLMAISLLGLTLLKLVLNDAWLLTAAQRAVVFAGTGVLLIGCSLSYHRFRELVRR